MTDIEVSFVGKFCVRESSSVNKNCFWYVLNSNGKITRETHINYMVRYLLVKNTSDGIVPYPEDKKVPFGSLKAWRVENARINIVLDVFKLSFAMDAFQVLI